jgi:hypothetical protein
MRRSSPGVLIDLLCLLLVGAAAAGVYWNNRRAYFVSDDFVLLDTVRQGLDLQRLFLANWLGESGRGGFYRPLVILSWWQNHLLFGLQPLGYHLTNIGLHALVASLLYLLVLRLGGWRRVALGTSLLFAVHPVHVEAVAWISGRTDPLCAVFVLAALLFWWSYLRTARTSQALLAMGMFVLALMSKEMAIVTPFLVALVSFVPCGPAPAPPARGRRLLPLLGFLGILLLYLVVRWLVLGGLGGYGAERHLALGGEVATNLRRYLNWLLQPLAVAPRTPGGAGILAVTGALALGLLVAWRPTRFPVLWVLICLAPVYSICRPQYLYFASMGAMLLLSLALLPLAGGPLRGSAAAVLIAGLIGHHAAAVRNQNRAWNRSGGTALGTGEILRSMAPTTYPDATWYFANLPYNRDTGFGVFQNGLQEALRIWFGAAAPRVRLIGAPLELSPADLAPDDRVFEFRRGMLIDQTERVRRKGVRMVELDLGSEGRLLVTPGEPGPALRLSAPARAVALELESLAADAWDLPQGFELAVVQLLDAAGKELARLPVRLGEHTAEWAYDRPDVRRVVKHERARVVRSWIEGVENPRPVIGHVYGARWTWEDPLPVAEVVVGFHASPRAIHEGTVLEIRRIALQLQ